MKYKPHRFFLYLGLRLLQGVVLWIPRSAAYALARGIAKIAFLLLGRERERTLQHLTLAYGNEKQPEEIRELAERIFIHWAETAVDVLRFPKLNLAEADRLIERGDGLAKINGILAEGKGMILLTAHLGNWELMGAYIRLHGIEGTVVGRRIYYEKYNQMIVNLREKFTLRTIYQDERPREFLRVLEKNQILGILADQDMDWAEGVFIPFFGRPAYTITAPVKLAMASGAPIVPVFLVREGRRYRLLVEEPIRVEMRGTREETIREYTAHWSRVVEEKIREYPEQWAWMHRRWKTIPAPETGVEKAVPTEVR
jgi:KDO2-lipid IV(A) lauroyltransferase